MNKNNLLNKLFVGFILIVITGFYACKQEYVSTGLGNFDPNGDLEIMGITLTAPGTNPGEFILDVPGGIEYDLDGASSSGSEKIDLVMLYDDSTGINIVAPSDIKRLSNWDIGQTINDSWVVKNEATLFKEDSSGTKIAAFDSLTTAGGLRSLYNEAKTSIGNPVDADEYGPGASLQDLKVGDLIFMHSTAREFYAVLKVAEISTNDKIFIRFEIKVDNNSSIDVPPADSSEIMKVYDLKFDNPGNTSGNRFADISTGELFTFGESIYHQESIDWICFNGSGTATNLMTPTAEDRLGAYGSGKQINGDWMVKNDGTFIRLNASDEADSLFLYAVNNSKIRDAFSYGEDHVESLPGYDSTLNGPGAFVYKEIAVGDVILFKSESRGIYAISKVKDLVSGNSGSVEFAMKVDNSGKIEVPAPPNRGLIMSSGGYGTARFIDLKMGVDYDEDSAKNISETIDLIFVRGSSSHVNLFPTTNEAAMKAFSSAIWPGRMAEWDVRNDGILVNSGSNAALYNTLKEGDFDAIKQAYDDAVVNYGTTARATQIKKNDIIFFESFDRDFYAVMRVVDADDAGELEIKWKVARQE